MQRPFNPDPVIGARRMYDRRSGIRHQAGSALMRFLSLVMMVFVAVVLWFAIGPEMCSASTDNRKYLQLGGIFFLVYVCFSLLTGVVYFRSQRVHRADNPFDYWLMVLGISGLTWFFFYPTFFCA